MKFEDLLLVANVDGFLCDMYAEIFVIGTFIPKEIVHHSQMQPQQA